MKTLIIIAACLASSTALAGGPTQGTFAGQETRGAAVSHNTDVARSSGTNYGQAVASDQAQRGVRDVGVQDYSVGQSTTVGYGRNK